jgi:uncharacterized protein
MTALEILARPGSRRDGVAWDRWREEWVVSCRAMAKEGEANDALLRLLSTWLRLPRTQLRWVGGVRGRRKVVEVSGLSAVEIDRRLGAVSQKVAPLDGSGAPVSLRHEVPPIVRPR